MKKSLILWCVFGLGVVEATRLSANVWRLTQAGQRVKDARKELVAAAAKQEQLKKELERVKDPEFALGEAREKLGLGKPGEEVIILPQNNTSPKSSASAKASADKANWRLWWEKWVRI